MNGIVSELIHSSRLGFPCDWIRVGLRGSPEELKYNILQNRVFFNVNIKCH